MKNPRSIGINVGASKEAVAEARLAIMDILKSDCDQDTKRVALDVLRDLCAVKNTTISGNVLLGPETSSN